MTTSPERIMLPTPAQVIDDIRRLLASSGGAVEFLKADFADPFLSLGVAAEGRGYVVVTDGR